LKLGGGRFKLTDGIVIDLCGNSGGGILGLKLGGGTAALKTGIFEILDGDEDGDGLLSSAFEVFGSLL
jgi:hypothetical protein